MSDLNSLSPRARREAVRALRNHKYDHTEAGLLVPSMKLHLNGLFEVSARNEPYEPAPNMVVTEGLTHILDVALSQATQKLAFYIGIFGGNVAVASSWTGANWVANATEFTNYDEATRQAWTDAGASAGAISNTASPALFTIATGGGTVRGAALVEASAKSATTGVLIAAARFSVDKVMAAAEELRVRYSLTATSS